jgi:hypothetical protein
MPTREVEILGNWYVSGLKGAGSNDFQVHDPFVAEDHALPAFTAKPTQPGTLYATPLISIFAVSLPTASFGIARAAQLTPLSHWRNQGTNGFHGEAMRQAGGTGRCRTPEALLRSARAFLFESVEELWNEVAVDKVPTLRHRAIARLAAAHTAASAAQAVDLLHNAAGLGVIRKQSTGTLFS